MVTLARPPAAPPRGSGWMRRDTAGGKRRRRSAGSSGRCPQEGQAALEGPDPFPGKGPRPQRPARRRRPPPAEANRGTARRQGPGGHQQQQDEKRPGTLRPAPDKTRLRPCTCRRLSRCRGGRTKPGQQTAGPVLPGRRGRRTGGHRRCSCRR